MRIARSIIFLLGTLSWLGCRAPHTGASQNVPEYLIVVPGATNIQHKQLNGQEQLAYQIQADYPADGVLNTVKTRLDQLGWKPLKEDFLNPGTPSSHVRAWNFIQAHPNSSLRSWVADWENSRHDIVTYAFLYRCPGDLCMSTAQTPHDLRVVAIYMPAAVAERMKTMLQQYRSK